jgi:hypothetical protein
MSRFVLLSLVLAFAPAVAAAQSAPLPTTGGGPTLNVQQQAALRQLRVRLQQSRLQTRARLLAALTPVHRTAVANIVGQLALALNPNPRAAAQTLDSVLPPVEKQSILNIAAAERANTQALRQQQKAVFAATLTEAERAQAAQREAQWQAYRQSHPRAMHVADPGAIVLRTLGSFGSPGRGRFSRTEYR